MTIMLPPKGSSFVFKALLAWAVGTALASILLIPSSSSAKDRKSRDLEIRTLSNRADLISGGDALVEIVLPRRTKANRVRVELNGRDITYEFATRADGRFLGLVKGLELGKNELTAAVGEAIERLTITNYPIGGPIFSGPQVQPWICQTVEGGLGPALDAQCNAPTKVEFFYRSTNPATGFLAYDPANPPSDVTTTTTDQGITVPYIVRREQGTLNRSIYSFAVLFDPSKPALPWLSPTGWNHKLFYLFEGGALPKHFQGVPISVFDSAYENVFSRAFDDLALSRGFAVATTSRDIMGNNSNSVTSAESVMMLKEHIVESLGEIRYTLSNGTSGGSLLQHLVADAYPGLVNGIQPSEALQDLWTTNTEAQDCSVLVRYFNSAPAQLWPSIAQQNTVLDNANELPGTCRGIVSKWPPYQLDDSWMNPTSTSCTAPGGTGFGPHEPWMYDPVTNPTGTRCTLQDYQVAIFGKRPDGFANAPYDNVGLQYGLNALQAGKITPEQFLDVNEKVGGRDIDWHWRPQRSTADLFALSAAYRSGQMNLGGGMATVADIDIGACAFTPTVNASLHSCFHTPSMRARLVKTNGQADNQVIMQLAPSDVSFDILDRWLEAIEADTSKDPLAVKVASNKPADAVDACWINGQKVIDAAVCAAAFPNFGNPRIGAGAPLEDEVLKCQLKALRRKDYAASFTDSQWARLQAAFPGGVCDWSKPSVGFRPAVPWLSFADGPGGRPLGPAPVSKPGGHRDDEGRNEHGPGDADGDGNEGGNDD